MWQMTILDLLAGQATRDVACLTRLTLRSSIAAAGATISTWLRRSAERREMLAFDWRMRRDTGIGPCELHRATRRPLWRA